MTVSAVSAARQRFEQLNRRIAAHRNDRCHGHIQIGGNQFVLRPRPVAAARNQDQRRFLFAQGTHERCASASGDQHRFSRHIVGYGITR